MNFRLPANPKALMTACAFALTVISAPALSNWGRESPYATFNHPQTCKHSHEGGTTLIRVASIKIARHTETVTCSGCQKTTLVWDDAIVRNISNSNDPGEDLVDIQVAGMDDVTKAQNLWPYAQYFSAVPRNTNMSFSAQFWGRKFFNLKASCKLTNNP
jgi:hypothetical protein